MDPQAVTVALLRALVEGDSPAAAEYARHLSVWLEAGGFPPTVHDGPGPQTFRVPPRPEARD
jgi:hypothetical protein